MEGSPTKNWPMNKGVLFSSGSRRIVESSRSVIATRNEFMIDLKTNKHSYSIGDELTGKVSTVAYTGTPVSKKVELDIKRLFYLNGKLNEDEVVLKKTLLTSTDGKAEFDFHLKDEGNYRITLSSVDSNGRTISQTRRIYVYSKSSSNCPV